MKLRTALLAGMGVLVAAIIAATVIAAVVVVGRAERRSVEADLDRTKQVFKDFLDFRHARLRSDCRVVANEPRLRAIVATQDISRETIVGVIGELRTALGSDLFLLTDGSGVLLADALEPKAEGYDMRANPVIAAALADGEGSAVWLTNERPYQVQGCRVDFGTNTVGVVVVGDAYDDAAAEVVHRQTGTAVVVSVDGNRAAAAGFTNAAAPGITSNVAEAQREVTVDGADLLVTGGNLPGYAGKRVVTYALVRSLDEALAPARRLVQSILLIAALALVIALVLTIAFAHRLSRPVSELVAFTKLIADGNLATRARPEGPTEVRTLASSMNVMVEELGKARNELAAKERLEREMEIAMRIQTSILPRTFDVSGLDIAARMLPASEVGGDYYDILPYKGGCWIGVGDVAGHGLTAGLEMLMVQSIVAALVRENPAAQPSDHLVVLNSVVYDNIRNRMEQDEHITLTLLKYEAGTISFAGAHEEILVCRRGDNPCERVATPGTWLGAMRDVRRVTHDTRLELDKGDIVVLYSDGITEATNGAEEMFGIDRLCELVEKHRTAKVEEIRDAIIEAVQRWQALQLDDITLVVIRRD